MDEYRLASERLSPNDARDWASCKIGDLVHTTRLGVSIHGVIIDIRDEGKKGLPKRIKITKIYAEVVTDKWFDSLSGPIGMITQRARDNLLNLQEIEILAHSFRGGDSSDRFEIIR